MPVEVEAQQGAWEEAKENAQPLRQGRGKSALALVHEANRPADEELENSRSEFEAALSDQAQGSDPLQVWCAYVKWAQENYSEGGKRSQLLSLLERCAHQFKDDDGYVDDVRYLRLWILYADHVRDAEQIFDYLYDRQIGQRHAVFWESWAAVLEAKQKLGKADEAYTRGVQAKAEPLSRLRRNHEQFQFRLMRRIQRGDPTPRADEADEAPRAPGGTAVQRKALNRLTKREAAKSKRPIGHRPAGALPTDAASSKRPSGTIGGNFQIYEDGAAAGDASSDASRAAWETGTATENIKENAGSATTWAGVKLPQKKQAAAPGPCPFEIMPDEGAADDDEAAESARRPPANVRLALDAPSAAERARLEQLMECPLERFRDKGDNAAEGQRAAALKQPAASVYSKAAVPAADATIGFDPSLLQLEGEEVSFEEVRARREFGFPDVRRTRAPAAAEADDRAHAPLREAAPVQASATAEMAPLQPHAEADQGGSDAEAAADVAVAPAGSRKRKPMAALADDEEAGIAIDDGVTVNTKAALRALMPSFIAELDDDDDARSISAHAPVDSAVACTASEGARGPGGASGSVCGVCGDDAGARRPLAATAAAEAAALTSEGGSGSAPKQASRAEPRPLESRSASGGAQHGAAGTAEFRHESAGGGSPQLEPTVNTKAALAALMPNFSGFVDEEEGDGGGGEGCGGEGGGAESHGEGRGAVLKHRAASTDGVSGCHDAPFSIFDDGADADEAVAAPSKRGGFAVFDDSAPKTTRAPNASAFAVFEDGAAAAETITSAGPPAGPAGPKCSILGEASVTEGCAAAAKAPSAVPFAVFDETVAGTGAEPMAAPAPARTARPFVVLEDAPDDDARALAETAAPESAAAPASAQPVRAPFAVFQDAPPEDAACARETAAATAAHERAAAVSDSHVGADETDLGSDVNPATFRGILKFLSKPPPQARFGTRPPSEEQPQGGGAGASPPVVVDPFSEAQQRADVAAVLPSLRASGGLFEHAPSPLPLALLSKGGEVALGEDGWHAGALLGAGAFGKVYVGTRTGGGQPMALKVSSERNVWEWHVLTALAARLPDSIWHAARADMQMHVFGPLEGPWRRAQQTGCSTVLLQPLAEGVTMQALVNEHRQAGTLPDELLVIFYTARLLRATQELHSAGIIHTDLKPDNVLVTCTDPSPLDCAESVCGRGWAGAGVRLVDFGRAIDARRYAEGAVFVGRAAAEDFECVEMQQGKPWRHQADAFAVCACAHFLLHAEYLKMVCREGTWRAQTNLKRYWNTALWKRFFDELLDNRDPGSGEAGDCPADLGALAEAFEAFLDESAARKQKLRQALHSQYAAMKANGMLRGKH